MTDEWHIKSTRSQVSGNQHRGLSLFETNVILEPTLGRYFPMQRAALHSLLRKRILDCTCRLNRIAENNAAGIILPRIFAILLADQLQWLQFVIVSELYEFVLEITQVHMGALLYECLEVWIKRIEEPSCHFFHLFAYGC